MSNLNEALQRLVAQVGAKTDVLVDGSPIQARQLLAEASVALAGQATVVSVASPIGELSLSALIAQLSGRLDFDDQDDSVLELGVRRLKGDGQTVLMVLAPAGISRSALRYLQLVSRQSPGLVMVAYRAPSLAPMLEEPGFASLRARLYAAPPIEVDALAEPAPPRALAVVPLVAVASPPPARKRRPGLWAASALGIAAAAAAVIWLGRSAPGTAVASSRATHAEVQLAAAMIPAPARADVPPPTAVTAAPAPLAHPARAALSMPPRIALATLPARPPSMPLVHSEVIVATNAQPPLRRPEAIKRELPRYVRARPYWPVPHDRESAYEEPAGQWDGVSPIWVRRDPGRRDYIGTYAVDPNGVRIFQYDR